jgi:hypothetical protein
MEPKLKLQGLVRDAGLDANRGNVLKFEVVDIGETVEGV